MGWFCVEDDSNHIRRETHPLLVGHTPVMVAKQPEFKVRLDPGSPSSSSSCTPHPGTSWGNFMCEPLYLAQPPSWTPISWPFPGCWHGVACMATRPSVHLQTQTVTLCCLQEAGLAAVWLC